MQPPAASAGRPGPAQPAGSVPAGPPAAPTANPYGSYVSAPAPGYPAPDVSHLDAVAYGTGFAAGRQAIAGANWYVSTPDDSPATSGYLPAPMASPGHNGASHGLPGRNGSGDGGPRGRAGYSAADYGASYSDPVYLDGRQGGGGRRGYQPGPYDQRGNGTPERGFDQDYRGYGGGAR